MRIRRNPEEDPVDHPADRLRDNFDYESSDALEDTVPHLGELSYCLSEEGWSLDVAVDYQEGGHETWDTCIIICDRGTEIRLKFLEGQLQERFGYKVGYEYCVTSTKRRDKGEGHSNSRGYVALLVLSTWKGLGIPSCHYQWNSVGDKVLLKVRLGKGVVVLEQGGSFEPRCMLELLKFRRMDVFGRQLNFVENGRNSGRRSKKLNGLKRKSDSIGRSSRELQEEVLSSRGSVRRPIQEEIFHLFTMNHTVVKSLHCELEDKARLTGEVL
ncbi:hypothetical protein Tco_1228414 [Tanacetum coccineum]